MSVNIETLLGSEEASTIDARIFETNFDEETFGRPCDFLIEKVEINDDFEETTPVVDLPGKGTVKLPRVPTTTAQLEHTPSKYPGPFNFQLQFEDESGGKPVPRATPFTYSPCAQRLFVQMNHKVPFRFTVADRVPTGTWLRIRARYTQPEYRNEPVVRCPNHRQDAEGPHAYHLMRCEVPGAVYEKDMTGHYSIRVPFNRCAFHNGMCMFHLELLCFSSCPGGLNRRPFEVTVALEHSSRILGCDSIDTRVCACPGRDRGAAEKRVRGDVGKKRGRKKKKPPKEPTGTPAHDDNKVHCLLVQGRTQYEILSRLMEGLEASAVPPSSSANTSTNTTTAAAAASATATNAPVNAAAALPPSAVATAPGAAETAEAVEAGPKRGAHPSHAITHEFGAADPHPHKRCKRGNKTLAEASFPAGASGEEETPGGDTEPESEGEEEGNNLTPRRQVKHAFLNLRLEQAVRAWLEAMGMEQYAHVFISNGYDDLDVVCDLSSEDLDYLGITRRGHRKKFLLAAQKLKSLLHQARAQADAARTAPRHQLHKTLSITRTTFRQSLPTEE